MHFTSLLLFVQFVSVAYAANVYNITLPWGIWQSTYDPVSKVYKFLNVRFGEPPIGNLRFQASRFPINTSNQIQKGSSDSCFQVNTNGKCAGGGQNPIVNPAAGQSEDCLFLDIYVPQSVMENNSKKERAAVAVWLFGGAYLFGSKNYMMTDKYNTPFYNGTQIVAQPNNKYPDDAKPDTIFVAGNYRIGAFGWLAGTSMEKNGYPNAGLSDQRLLFDWVARYISQIGGDPNKVSAWGESAGASSILHHLISRNGSQQLVPKFQRVAIQSPAYQWIFDRQGFMEQTYINYTCYVCAVETSKDCCPSGKIQPTPLYTVQQLSTKASATLVMANQRLFQETQQCNGLFPVGPSVDGNVIQHLAAVELINKRSAPLDSMIVSHVQYEAATFISHFGNPNDAQFDLILQSLFGGDKLKQVRQNIASRYASGNYSSNGTRRIEATVQDSMFLSNNRLLVDRYLGMKTPVYTLSWDALNGTHWDKSWPDASVHGTDLVPLFYNSDWDLYGFIKNTYPQFNMSSFWFSQLRTLIAGALSVPYQRYWANHAATGKPYNGQNSLEEWDAAVAAPEGVKNTCMVRVAVPAFNPPSVSQTDTLLPEAMGTFWAQQASFIDGVYNSEAPSDAFAVESDGSQAPLMDL